MIESKVQGITDAEVQSTRAVQAKTEAARGTLYLTLQQSIDEAIARLSVDAIYSDHSHQFKVSGDKHRGGCPYHRSGSNSSFVVNAATKLFWCEGCQFGGNALDYIHSLKVGRWEKKLRGTDFIEAVKVLLELAGMSLPSKEQSQQDIEKARFWESRRNILNAVTEYGREVLWSERGVAARKYLIEERNLSEANIRDLGLGLYHSVAEFKQILNGRNINLDDAKKACVLWKQLEGYILFPWLDSRGRPLTIYGRWHTKVPPETTPPTPKTIALKGIGSKASPLYFDRVVKAGHKEIVLVEGVLDAALLQAKGDTRVAAYVAASCSGEQIEDLNRHRIAKVTLCGDPDAGGENGTKSNLRRISEAGITVFVAPKLPNGLDPDEFLVREGMDGWKRHIDGAVHGYTYKARSIISAEVSNGELTDKVKQLILEQAIAFAKTIHAPKDKVALQTFFWPAVCEALGMDIEQVREQLESAYQAPSVSEQPRACHKNPNPHLENFDPLHEFNQWLKRDLYGDKHWICIENTLYRWNGINYEASSDVVESRRIFSYADRYSEVKENTGETEYPYANPASVKQALNWIKIWCGTDPKLVNPPGLNCTNGVLQISWQGKKPQWNLVDHSPSLYYTYEPMVTYKPEADSAHCDRLLEVLDKPQREVFLRSVAASLDIATVRKYKGRLVRALLLKGHGSNGKDTLRECVAAIYGYKGITSATLSDFSAYDQGRKFPLSKLIHSRVNWASENANTDRMDKIQSLKAFITGDPLSIEGKGRDEYEFTPVGIGLFNVNDTPNLQAAQEAIKSRYGVLTFNKTFKINADTSKNELEADPRFKYDPEFLRNEVLPAFLNRVLAALVNLMESGIDFECTEQALEDIQAANSHLFQFCRDVGLGYETNATTTAKGIWEQLEEWYIDSGTLVYEQSGSGKTKAIWTDQANPRDRNCKAAHQVIARFQALFPKAKRVTVGKGQVGLQGIGFGSPTTPPLSDLKPTESLQPAPSMDGEPTPPYGEPMVSLQVSLQPAPSMDGEPVAPISNIAENFGMENSDEDEKDFSETVETISISEGRQAHHPLPEPVCRLTDSLAIASPSADVGSPSPKIEQSLKVGDRVEINSPGSKRHGKQGTVKKIRQELGVLLLADVFVDGESRPWEAQMKWLKKLGGKT